MNAPWMLKLLARCRTEPVYDDMRRHGAQLSPAVITADEIAFVVFADHVETWIRELEEILEALQHPQADDYSPQCDWPVQAWIAYHGGKLCSIDRQLNGKLACIAGPVRDATPRMAHFIRLYDQANELYFKLREQHGMNGLQPKKAAREDARPTEAKQYPPHAPNSDTIH